MVGVCGRRHARIEAIALELADRRELARRGCAATGSTRSRATGSGAAWCRLIEILVAEIPFMDVVAHTERRADVLEIVLHDLSPILRARASRACWHRLEVASRFVQAPKHAQRAQARGGARAGRHRSGSSGRVPAERKLPQDLAEDQASGHDAIGPIGVAVRPVPGSRCRSSQDERCLGPDGRRTWALGSIVASFGSNVVRNVSTWL